MASWCATAGTTVVSASVVCCMARVPVTCYHAILSFYPSFSLLLPPPPNNTDNTRRQPRVKSKIRIILYYYFTDILSQTLSIAARPPTNKVEILWKSHGRTRIARAHVTIPVRFELASPTLMPQFLPRRFADDATRTLPCAPRVDQF